MRIPHLVTAAALGAIALAACGSGSSYSASANAPNPASTTPSTTAVTVDVTTGDTSLGKVLVDADGHTLYGLTEDVDGMPTCVDACANAWPPLTVDGTDVPAGLDAKTFSVVARADGSHQLKAGKWPLYRFAGDTAAGETNGQGSGGVWFATTPTGTLHKS